MPDGGPEFGRRSVLGIRALTSEHRVANSDILHADVLAPAAQENIDAGTSQKMLGLAERLLRKATTDTRRSFLKKLRGILVVPFMGRAEFFGVSGQVNSVLSPLESAVVQEGADYAALRDKGESLLDLISVTDDPGQIAAALSGFRKTLEVYRNSSAKLTQFGLYDLADIPEAIALKQDLLGRALDILPNNKVLNPEALFAQYARDIEQNVGTEYALKFGQPLAGIKADSERIREVVGKNKANVTKFEGAYREALESEELGTLLGQEFVLVVADEKIGGFRVGIDLEVIRLEMSKRKSSAGYTLVVKKIARMNAEVIADKILGLSNGEASVGISDFAIRVIPGADKPKKILRVDESLQILVSTEGDEVEINNTLNNFCLEQKTQEPPKEPGVYSKRPGTIVII